MTFGPLLFSLTLSELLQSTQAPNEVVLQIPYLDNGTLIGPTADVAKMLNDIGNIHPKFVLHLNCSKCEAYWLSGDTNLPPEIIRFKNGVSLLGSPIWGSPDYSSPMVACLVDRLASSRLKFELDNPR